MYYVRFPLLTLLLMSMRAPNKKQKQISLFSQLHRRSSEAKRASPEPEILFRFSMHPWLQNG